MIMSDLKINCNKKVSVINLDQIRGHFFV
jgi:hypothetical protein